LPLKSRARTPILPKLGPVGEFAVSLVNRNPLVLGLKIPLSISHLFAGVDVPIPTFQSEPTVPPATPT